MSANQNHNRAWVLGMFETGLTAIRSLGRAGIPVTGVDWNPNMPGCYSRYANFERAPSPVEEPKALLDWFIQKGKQSTIPSVLLPATDAYVNFISRYRDALSPYFLFTLPPAKIVEALLDKFLHARLAEEMGDKSPLTFLIDERTDLSVVSGQLHYPAFVKARHTHLWKQVYSDKGFKVTTPEDFLQTCEQIINNKLSAVVQEIISAPMTNHYEVSFYRSVQKGHPILAVFPVRKIRQYPSGFGSGSLVETFDNAAVVERTLKFAEKIDFQGIGNIEYIYDDKTREYYLVELNARLWQQNVQADYCGVNFPLIAYYDILGESQPALLKTMPGVKWMDLISDFQSFWEQYKDGSLSIGDWLHSLNGVKVFATFAWDDSNPILHEFQYGLKFLKLPIYLFRHWRTE